MKYNNILQYIVLVWYICHKHMTNIDEKIISDAGLTTEQARIYLFLLNTGLSSAKVISSKTGVGRALVYKVLEQLKDLKLVEVRDDIGKISLFSSANPSVLKNFIEERKMNIENSTEMFNKHFGALSSKFNALSGKPHVQFLEGLDGLREMYDDIINEGKDIKLIRSLLDHKNDSIALILREHIKKQTEAGIKVQLIGPPREEVPLEVIKQKDAERHVTRRVVAENFLIPSQVIIYANKVSITDFKGEIVITIIENPDVRETFEKMFNFMFENGEKAY